MCVIDVHAHKNSRYTTLSKIIYLPVFPLLVDAMINEV